MISHTPHNDHAFLLGNNKDDLLLGCKSCFVFAGLKITCQNTLICGISLEIDTRNW